MSRAADALRPGLAVVKLGGSFIGSPHLQTVLGAINTASVPVVIVPGGGPFADAVRCAQRKLGFHDAIAHRMALLAMAQCAELFAGLTPRLRVANSVAAIRAALAGYAVPVCSPWPMRDGVDALPESWELTSDSLAAWLAALLGAERLILLKHRDPPDRPISLGEAADAGIVDALFPAYAAAFSAGFASSPGSGSASVWWLGPTHFYVLTDFLEGRLQAGLRLRADLPECLPT